MTIAQKLWNSILSGVTVTHTNKACINGPDENIERPRELAGLLPQSLDESLPSSPVLPPLEESVFIRQGDYWTIRYQGQAAILKATRGLDCLCYLLRHPGRDVYVTQLLGTPVDFPLPAFLGSLKAVGDAVTAGRQDAAPILDSKAKTEYQGRIDELRKDREQAERSNDFYSAARARSELEAIAEQLAAAVGLGARDRRSSSHSERARSAVTKRIKEGIHRIGKVIPPLGRHLAARIKTGYFCSYNPHPDRPVAWKF